MFKKSLYFFLSALVFQNACHADAKDQLSHVNQEYTALMAGRDGILNVQATPQQINQMIDGCITAGIIDRLYHFPPKDNMFHDQIRKFEGFRKLDVQLAYAFYKLGYDNWNEGKLEENLRSIDANFDIHKFYELSAHVCNGSIFEYRNRLENVIKRTSKPLHFDDFVEIENTQPSGTVTPVTTRSMRSVGSSFTLKQNVCESDAYKTYIDLGVPHDKAMQLLRQVVNEYTEPEEDISSHLSSLAFSPGGDAKAERHYTDTEISTLENTNARDASFYRGKKERYYTDTEISTLENTNARAASFYKTKKAEKMPADEIRAKLKSIMKIDIDPKY